MSNIQNAILEYARRSRYLAPLLEFSEIMVLFYPIYALVTRIGFLRFLWNITDSIYAVYRIAFYLGLILCFARRQMFPLAAAFGLRTVSYILTLFSYRISLNTLIYILFYGLLTALCIFAHSEEEPAPASGVVKRPRPVAQIERQESGALFCPKCGAERTEDMRFCNNCGYELHQN